MERVYYKVHNFWKFENLNMGFLCTTKTLWVFQRAFQIFNQNFWKANLWWDSHLQKAVLYTSSNPFKKYKEPAKIIVLLDLLEEKM